MSEPFERCEGCDGEGVRAPATPACAFKLTPIPKTHCVVERCDYCEKFEGDFSAAYWDPLPRWVSCDDGHGHVIALIPIQAL